MNGTNEDAPTPDNKQVKGDGVFSQMDTDVFRQVRSISTLFHFCAPLKAFSLTWPAVMQIYWNKRKFLRIKKKVQFPGLVRDSIMAAITLFWDTNMVEITSCENALYECPNSFGTFSISHRVERKVDFVFNSLSFFKTNSLDADFFFAKKEGKSTSLKPSFLFPLTQVLKDVITKRTLAIEKRVLADVEALKTQVCELEAQKIQLQCDSERLKQTLKEITTKQEKVRRFKLMSVSLL